MTAGEFPWWITSTSASYQSMTYRQTHMADTWADAVAYAIRLRVRGHSSDKPVVRRLGERWEVRWIPRYVAYNFTA